MHSFVNIENVTLLWRCQCFDTLYYMFVMFSWQPICCSLVLLHYLFWCYALCWLTCCGGFISDGTVFVLKRDVKLQPTSDDYFMSDGCYSLVLRLMVKKLQIGPALCKATAESMSTRVPDVRLFSCAVYLSTGGCQRLSLSEPSTGGCQWLSLSESITGGCQWLSLSESSTGGCQWLSLSESSTGGCQWLSLSESITGGCQW